MREWFGLNQVYWLKPFFPLLVNPLTQEGASSINFVTILPMLDKVILTSITGKLLLCFLIHKLKLGKLWKITPNKVLITKSKISHVQLVSYHNFIIKMTKILFKGIFNQIKKLKSKVFNLVKNNLKYQY